ncbi:MGMT family protein [Cryobacterium psychrophilum]|uniref:DNA-binding protein n=1 Tax=Cryobacterium psychrophilum TaxID=41988 RepID=A0A4Y8KXI0_9MICO|nr:MGMT family protein [Cryobacterium psychrophilum]TDW29584.1 O(6)-alkylguanine repair protein YbaZ [Cryobacterium psychrophilum]TFD81716.1 DNA-binding protein [Cryobacterium psychrophilum]
MHSAQDDDFVSHVLGIVDAIPPGRVMTYGDVAAVLGSRAARAVGQVMARYGTDMPWWRVVRAGGHPPIEHEDRALEHYLAEGTPLVPRTPTHAYRIDYAAARWSPA